MAVRGWPRALILSWGEFREIPRRPEGETEDAQIEPIVDAPSRARVTGSGNAVQLGAFDLQVRVAPGGSWVVRGTKTPMLLAHEQSHLDIAGLVAYENHRATSAAHLEQLVTATRQRMDAKLNTLTERYDRETDHSRNTVQQNAWNQLIATSIRNGYRASPDR